LKKLSAILAVMLAGCATVAAPPELPVTESELRKTVAVLASDDLEGRFPGTAGEDKTLAYLADRFAAAGLVNGARGTKPFRDPVEMVRVVRGEDRVTLTSLDGSVLSLPRTDAFASGRADRVSITDAPLTFVGYGVDREGEIAGDHRGKVVIMLGDPPPFLGDDQADRRQASRREFDFLKSGALAVLGLYSVPAERQAQAIAAGRQQQAFRRALRWAGDDGRWEVRGGIAAEPLRELIARAGINLAALVSQARDPGFRARDLPWRISIEQNNKPEPLLSHNLIGKLPGKRPDGKAVLLMARWDHLGRCQ
jgi:hypothetical protein